MSKRGAPSFDRSVTTLLFSFSRAVVSETLRLSSARPPKNPPGLRRPPPPNTGAVVDVVVDDVDVTADALVALGRDPDVEPGGQALDVGGEDILAAAGDPHRVQGTQDD